MTTEQRDEIRELGITRKLTDVLARAPIFEAPAGNAPLRACPALRADEVECRDGGHEIAGTAHPKTGRNATYRDCPMKLYRDERKRFKAQLALCGYDERRDELAEPIAASLWALLDRQRGVTGLGELIDAISTIIERGPRSGGHLALIGTVGTAKTHALLLLYFWALHCGVRVSWVTSSELRELAQEMRSFDEERQAAAQGRLKFLRGRELIIIDDLGDQLSDIRAREPGSTGVSALLQDLLNGSMARLFWSSNLGIMLPVASDNPKARQAESQRAMDELRGHADLGPRVTDRLFADHRGVAAIRVQLEGASQRYHHARAARRGKKEAA